MLLLNITNNTNKDNKKIRNLKNNLSSLFLEFYNYKNIILYNTLAASSASCERSPFSSVTVPLKTSPFVLSIK